MRQLWLSKLDKGSFNLVFEMFCDCFGVCTLFRGVSHRIGVHRRPTLLSLDLQTRLFCSPPKTKEFSQGVNLLVQDILVFEVAST